MFAVATFLCTGQQSGHCCSTPLMSVTGGWGWLLQAAAICHTYERYTDRAETERNFMKVLPRFPAQLGSEEAIINQASPRAHGVLSL